LQTETDYKNIAEPLKGVYLQHSVCSRPHCLSLTCYKETIAYQLLLSAGAQSCDVMNFRKGARVELDVVWGRYTDGTVSATVCHPWVLHSKSSDSLCLKSSIWWLWNTHVKYFLLSGSLVRQINSEMPENYEVKLGCVLAW